MTWEDDRDRAVDIPAHENNAQDNENRDNTGRDIIFQFDASPSEDVRNQETRNEPPQPDRVHLVPPNIGRSISNASEEPQFRWCQEGINRSLNDEEWARVDDLHVQNLDTGRVYRINWYGAEREFTCRLQPASQYNSSQHIGQIDAMCLPAEFRQASRTSDQNNGGEPTGVDPSHVIDHLNTSSGPEPVADIEPSNNSMPVSPKLTQESAKRKASTKKMTTATAIGIGICIVLSAFAVYGICQWVIYQSEAATIDTCPIMDTMPEADESPEIVSSPDGKISVSCFAFFVLESNKKLRYRVFKLEQVLTSHEKPSIILKFNCATLGLNLQSNSTTRQHQLDYAWLPSDASGKNQARWSRSSTSNQIKFGFQQYYSCTKRMTFQRDRNGSQNDNEYVQIANLMVQVDNHDGAIREAISC